MIFKKIFLILSILFSCVSAHAYDDFIVTNYGFATDGYNFYVDETGYMVLKEGLEADRVFVRGLPIGMRGQDITAASYTPIWWDGDFVHVNGNAQVETLTKTLPEHKEYTAYFTGIPVIKNGASSSVDGYPMKLANGQDAHGPIILKFIRDGNLWIETGRVQF